MRTCCVAFACLIGALSAAQDPQKTKSTLKDIDLVGSWIYNDLNAGFAEAKKTGKPMLVVFR